MNPRLSYLQGAVAGASPVGLVILLYGQAIEDLRRAVAAHGRGDVEGRTREINHALVVIAHLQATLDKNKGGLVAGHLDRFYNQLRAGLVAAQCQQSAAALEEQIFCLMQLRDAWNTVERSEATLIAQKAVSQATPRQFAALDSPGDPGRGRWKA